MRIGVGVFADVFSSEDGTRAFKLFRRIADPALGHTAPFIFRAEVAGYEAAVKSEALSRHIPTWFGPHVVDVVRDSDGSEISERY